jgi:hypothetical protein
MNLKKLKEFSVSLISKIPTKGGIDVRELILILNYLSLIVDEYLLVGADPNPDIFSKLGKDSTELEKILGPLPETGMISKQRMSILLGKAFQTGFALQKNKQKIDDLVSMVWRYKIFIRVFLIKKRHLVQAEKELTKKWPTFNTKKPVVSGAILDESCKKIWQSIAGEVKQKNVH